jgi:hypothetical protein
MPQEINGVESNEEVTPVEPTEEVDGFGRDDEIGLPKKVETDEVAEEPKEAVE